MPFSLAKGAGYYSAVRKSDPGCVSASHTGSNGWKAARDLWYMERAQTRFFACLVANMRSTCQVHHIEILVSCLHILTFSQLFSYLKINLIRFLNVLSRFEWYSI